jgi:hypothetical protein
MGLDYVNKGHFTSIFQGWKMAMILGPYQAAKKAFSQHVLSFPSKRESSLFNAFWTPAFSGVTDLGGFSASC